MTKEEPGLVISPITGRSEIEQQLNDLAGKMNFEGELRDAGEHVIVLTPGSVRLKRRGVRATETKQVSSARDRITSWSRKSRANMVSRFSSLDLTPLRVMNQHALAVMVTLTYPRDWEALVPTANHAKKHLQRFRKRFERRFGHPLYAMWKAEFQRRGAVHFHIFTASPAPLAEFRRWVASTWSDIVQAEPEEERLKHLRSGTAVDVAPGATIDQAHLVAVYFSKHSSANFGAKEYQNRPPDKWVEAGSVGRFWGYWTLKPVEVEARLSEKEAIALARLLRRWFRSKRFTRVEKVPRVNKRGTIKHRRVRRRNKRLSQSFGFITLEDSVCIIQDLDRFLVLYRESVNTREESCSSGQSLEADSLLTHRKNLS